MNAADGQTHPKGPGDVSRSESGLDDIDGDILEDYCSICLQMFEDKAVLPDCSHEFCFDCVLTWTGQSRRCPLCTQTIGEYLIHHIRSKYDYQKHHLVPLRSSPPPIQPLRRINTRPSRRLVRERRWGQRLREDHEDADALERAIDKRRWVYQTRMYAKHVASNSFTRFRPCPTPEQISKSPDLISRATIFIRRELRVWVNLDVEFLTTFVVSLLKAIDVRSESSIRLLAEFLDMDITYFEGVRCPNAEHFAHELYSFLRSPYKTLAAYDENVEYDLPTFDVDSGLRQSHITAAYDGRSAVGGVQASQRIVSNRHNNLDILGSQRSQLSDNYAETSKSDRNNIVVDGQASRSVLVEVQNPALNTSNVICSALPKQQVRLKDPIRLVKDHLSKAATPVIVGEVSLQGRHSDNIFPTLLSRISTRLSPVSLRTCTEKDGIPDEVGCGRTEISAAIASLAPEFGDRREHKSSKLHVTHAVEPSTAPKPMHLAKSSVGAELTIRLEREKALLQDSMVHDDVRCLTRGSVSQGITADLSAAERKLKIEARMRTRLAQEKRGGQ